ncbi:MAG: FtsX-like permease family protein [Dermatophilaceae bacterium]
MLRATWTSLLARKLRLALTAVAVALGVAFVAGSLVFTDTLGRTFDSIMLGSTGDVVVRPVRTSVLDDGGTTAPAARVSGADLEKLRRVEGVARIDGNVFVPDAFVVGKDGKLVATSGGPAIGTNWTEAPSLAGTDFVRIHSGRAPAGHLEVLLDSRTATRAGYVVGDRVRVIVARASTPIVGTLVGIGDIGGSLAGSTLVVFDTPTAQELFTAGQDRYQDAWVTAAPGVDRAALAARLGPVLPAGLEAVDGRKVADEAATSIQQALRFISTFLLVFAGIALVVGTFLIVNTFAILVAQRTRELALLRALGARRGQVTRSVLAEATVVGLVGATVGLLGGMALAKGIQLLMTVIGLDLTDASLVLSPRTVIVGYAVGLVVTLLAAWVPARRAGAVPPVAAMADNPSMRESSAGLRVVTAAILLALGAAGLVVGTAFDVGGRMAFVGLGVLLVLLGVSAASPIVGKPVVWAVGWLYRRVYGAVGHLAAENAVRNPRRTAATASALMIGMALVSTMAVLGQSANTSIHRLVSQNLYGDYQVSSPMYVAFSPTVADRAAAVPGVESVSRQRYLAATEGGARVGLMAIDPAARQTVTRALVAGSLGDFAGRALYVDRTEADARHWHVGSTVSLTGPAGTPQDFRVVALFAQPPSLSNTVVTTLDGARALGGPEEDTAVTVFRSPGADPAAVRSGLDAVVADLPTVLVQSTPDYIEGQLGSISQLLGIVYALLGLGVVIAVLGIVNTLALSVIERTREIGLLRALGLRRRQLRRMVRLESVAIALLGAVLGTGLGIVFGVALQRPLVDSGIDVLDVPAGQLLGFLVVAVVVGVLAAIWPARRAARMDVLAAIAAA